MRTIREFAFFAFFALLPVTSACAQQKLMVGNGQAIMSDGWADSVAVYRERARQGEVEAYRKLGAMRMESVSMRISSI